LIQIILAIGLDDQPFHIVGLSMGGALAGLYTAKYPQYIDRVTMMCPASKYQQSEKIKDVNVSLSANIFQYDVFHTKVNVFIGYNATTCFYSHHLQSGICV